MAAAPSTSIDVMRGFFNDTATVEDRRAVNFFLGNGVRNMYTSELPNPLLGPMRVLSGHLGHHSTGIVESIVLDYPG